MISNADFVQVRVREYYAQRGEWAGVFVIDRIDKMRFEKRSDNEIIVHVLYFFKPTMNQIRVDRRTGSDKRTFTFRYNGSDWQVVSMGGFGSGSL